MWRRLTNRLYAGNGTNHGYSSGLCCSLFLCISPFFVHLCLIYSSLPKLSLSFQLLPLFFTAVCLMTHVIIGASHTSLNLTPTSVLLSAPHINPILGFPILQRTLSSPQFLIHWPPCITQSTPLRQIIIPSAVTKEMRTPSITMYKFSVRGFGRVLIKKPFHSFS